jgi:hypothetical protein
MLHRRPSAAELRGSRPAFILTVSWLGRTYRFADRPLTIYNNAGEPLRYDGSLDVRSLQDSLRRSDSTPQGGTASMSVVFPDVSMMAEYIAGRMLEVAVCELSMVFVRGDTALTVYERRLIQITGPVSRPQIGFPDRAAGYAAFTITSRPFDDTQPVLDPQKNIGPVSLFGSPVDYQGSPYPLVIGSPGDGDSPGSPGYLISVTGSENLVLIAAGRVVASRVTMYDEDGERYTTATVEHRTDAYGNLYAYTDVHNAGASFNRVSGSHHVGWHFAGEPTYGLRNPYGRGGLEAGGDVIRYMLELSGAAVDDAAFRSAEPALNRYKFAGYVNDATVTAWQLLSSQVLPFMPVQLRIGADGVYPVSLLPLNSIGQLPQLTLDAARGIVQVSPVQVLQRLADLTNELGIKYKRNDLQNKLMDTLIETADTTVSDRARLLEGQRSRELYGRRPGATVDVSYIQEDSTAERVLRWLIYDRGFMHLAVQVQAAPRYGWLMVGDQISLTATDLALTGQRATVTSKAWNGSAWRFVLSWSMAPMELGGIG